MHLHPYTIDGVIKESRWVNVGQIQNEKKKSNFLFVYIGKNQHNLNLLSDFSRYQITAGSFLEAENLILESIAKEDKSPDGIFIDLPLDKSELKEFLNFLKITGLLFKSSVIYNQNHLSHHKIKFLKSLGSIDDISDFSSVHIDFKNKVWFINRFKEEQIEKDFSQMKPANESFLRSLSSTMKRCFDISLSVTALLLALPVLLLIILAIRLESKGPVFYISLRAGRGYKIIRFFKFRSMAENEDKNLQNYMHLNQYSSSTFVKIDNDPRVTRVGKFLRNTSLDEIPQLLNVLKGDMSIVGNRPLPLYEAKTLTTNKFVERFQAPAGITGLWQVKKRGKSEMSIDERIGLDIEYARNHNFLYDMGIILSTPKALLQKSDV